MTFWCILELYNFYLCQLMSYSRKLSSSTVILYFLLRLCYNAPSLWNGIPVEIQLRSFTGILCKSTESLPFLPEHILPNHLGFSASLEKILHCCTTSVLCTPPPPLLTSTFAMAVPAEWNRLPLEYQIPTGHLAN